MSTDIDYDRVTSYVYDIVVENKIPIYDNEMTDEEIEEELEDDDQ